MNYLKTQNLAFFPLFAPMITGACLEHRDGPYHFEKHIHPHFELYLIESGSCVMNIHNQNHQFYADDLILILPNTVHSFSVLEQECSFWHLHFKTDLLVNVLLTQTLDVSVSLMDSLLFYCTFFYTQKACQKIKEEIISIIELAQEKSEFSSALANVRLIEFLLDIIHKQTVLEANTNGTHIKNHYISFTLQYIQEHYSQKILVTDIARQLNISARYLSKIFHQHMNLTLAHYINIYRMNQAIQLMSSTNLSLLEIALAIGLKDAQHFSRLFVQIMNMAPGKYRKLIKRQK